jgi:hypothetical protein
MFLEVDGPMTFLTSVIRLRTARKRYTSCYVYTGCMRVTALHLCSVFTSLVEFEHMRTWGGQVGSGTPEWDKVLLRSKGGTALGRCASGTSRAWRRC